ncbi:MAG: hypothetical protein KGL53_11880, partial [Elusimicrobia bacterium]|nr:hypothetical protein [Elusimicrobiota bacterium]
PRPCSGLDFGGVQWPPDAGPDDQLALKTALNVSGSYEGPDGWANITGNFDGQGLSLGLLNQNLGQGSLQPMLLRLRDQHPEVLRAVLAPAHEASLRAMLAAWAATASPASPWVPRSPLDEAPPGVQLMSAPNAASVAWARDTLYQGGRFDPAWKDELTRLAATPEYVSIQVAAASDLHLRALGYEKQVGVRELRAYMMLFDINVQDGGLYPEDLADYAAYVKAHRKASSTARLEKLLALRLRHVRKAYVQDVRARKRTIILGTGVVHGVRRDLPAQYCYDGAWAYK